MGKTTAEETTENVVKEAELAKEKANKLTNAVETLGLKY